MSAVKLAEAGMASAQARKWDEAITSLTKAIEQSKSPQWLLARSQALMETGQLDRALRDAEFAYCTAAERGNDKSRKQMIEAQHRRSVIYFRRKLYANADACASWSQQLAQGVAVKAADNTGEFVDEKGFYQVTAADVAPAKAAEQKQQQQQQQQDGGNGSGESDWKKALAWRSTIVRFLEALPAEDPARRITVKLVPVKPSLDQGEDDKDAAEQKKAKEEISRAEIEAAKASAATTQPKPATASGPFRSQMYQSDASITVSLFMKFASKEDTTKVQVDMQPNLITISGVPREPSVSYIVPHAAIDPSKSTYRVATMKIEFTLAKAQPGKWATFGREELSQPDASTLPTATDAPTSSQQAPEKRQEPAAAVKPQGPAYPTSSKSGPKDWDHLADDEKDDDDKDVNAFFKQLYKGATPDQQRAMMKSFQESNGTALSTDWASVSKETVKTSPPDGVEAKKW
ncbi:SGS domain-domain-containing protein [Coniella lustricola]|uniref:SGS domain-domain-containing protein n=1 Tax=Coniella lustricola TaxID=2025994 RepID=A0A2T2ZZG6_9PEZI|nr:SGS domain-domain-containing protein [Coniella lustricola]